MPLPSIGLTVPARVCDRCYNDIGGMLTKPAHTEQVLSSGEEDLTVNRMFEDKPERRRERRSAVVDELASRVQTSSLASPET